MSSSSSSVKTELITSGNSIVKRTEEIRNVNKEIARNLGGQLSNTDYNARRNTNQYNTDGDVDKLAEKFIAKFHLKLEMERLRSLERYQEMLRRGV